MTFSAVLDNVIALVVIILVLSLIVQSVQQALKKLFKIKSRQLEASLVDLFETVLDKGNGTERATAPLLEVLHVLPEQKTSLDASVRTLYNSVTAEFRKLGRVAQSGKLMLDSISKADLVKVIGKVKPDELLGGTVFSAELQDVCNEIAAAQHTVSTLRVELLTGSASADFSALRDRLTPITNDLAALLDGGTLKSGLVIEDILRLREISLTGIFELLGKVQDGLQRQIGTAVGQDKIDLETLAKGLNDLAASLNRLRQKADAALIPLRTRLASVETWFDTVMQGFEERYTRGMKTWGLVISFVIVVLMNANVFDIYAKISHNDATRTKIMAMADDIQNRVKNPPAATGTATMKDLANSVQDIQANVNTYKGLEFQPLTWAAVKAGVVNNGFLDNFKIVIGWIIMTLLLSVGAPFWEDTLESLFGVKSLLRQKGSIKNVEEASGAGNPKS